MIIISLIMHDVSNNSLPANISNLLLYPTQVHSYNTRFSEIGSLTLNIPGQISGYNIHFLYLACARIWNSIPQSIRTPPKHKFKVSLHQLL